ncbi:ATP-binding cassette transporter [Ganoderma sinense ZZ0214-1]|uniref:ATP-binding cassette transporter n=1 Tax=Ganoderma sinense ZZ0214-1 TaxID=1077348 RepID=A0A2G8SJK0_9APHY|nr:ATP-binding cassette transporter [Ganoderma sinense ZZ0214-1]
MWRPGRQTNTFSDRKGTFDPTDTRHVKHTKLEVWDFYEEREPKLARIPGSSSLEKYMDLLEGLPYVWRMVKDVLAIPTCAVLLLLYAVGQLGQAIFPALGLWYQGQLLNIVQVAIDTRTVDASHLLHVSAGRIMCSLAQRAMAILSFRVQEPLTARIGRWYGVRLFHARARLDLPTYETTNVQRQLDEVFPESDLGKIPVAFEALQTAAIFVRAGTQVLAQGFALMQVLGEHRDGLLLCVITGLSQGTMWFSQLNAMQPTRVWAATTTNEEYVKMQGWRRVVSDAAHRKEIVAGNLGEYASSEFKKASDKVGDKAGEFREQQRWEAVRQGFSLWTLFEHPFQYVPHIVFALRAIQYPASIPVSLASLHLIQSAMHGLIANFYRLANSTSSVAEQLAAVRKLYEVGNIKNKVQDGTVPFPEDASEIKSSVAVEFRNVSFKYPGAENYALRNISFKLAPGQLCVIVGVNGSGKSTILKLIVRLYDPDEEEILIGGHDIRTLKLHDLRQAISVLFQDFTHFPLSIRDNIAIGDPSAAGDDDHVRLAARLGGAESFIEKLPDGFNTYLDRPVRDLKERRHSSDAASTTARCGMQGIAVARTFMRSVVSEDTNVGLLLFDEPSASLDPVAEHDLFNRLRELRGSKTMLFSSHRFGNLTRHADLILYMNESVVVEAGTHEELLKREGEYANIWKLQAQAFM